MICTSKPNSSTDTFETTFLRSLRDHPDAIVADRNVMIDADGEAISHERIKRPATLEEVRDRLMDIAKDPDRTRLHAELMASYRSA